MLRRMQCLGYGTGWGGGARGLSAAAPHGNHRARKHTLGTASLIKYNSTAHMTTHASATF